MNSIKKVATLVLIALVIITSIVALLGIWDIIDLKEILSKLMASLIVLFAASAVILFIYSVLNKEDQSNRS